MLKGSRVYNSPTKRSDVPELDALYPFSSLASKERFDEFLEWWDK